MADDKEKLTRWEGLFGERILRCDADLSEVCERLAEAITVVNEWPEVAMCPACYSQKKKTKKKIKKANP